MTDNYQEVFRLSPNLFIEGSPVIIETGVLYEDLNNNKIYAILNIKNLHKVSIMSCKVSIKAYDSAGEELQGVSAYNYSDLNTGLGEDFGSMIPIYLHNRTQKFSVAVIEATFVNGEKWSNEYVEWKQIPAQELLEMKLPSFELQNEYQMIAGMDSFYVPVIQNGLFQCTCGTANLASADCCYKCHNTYKNLTELLDVQTLSEKKSERIAKETKEREKTRLFVEAEKQKTEQLKEENRKKNTKKILTIAIPIIIIVAIIVALTPTVIKPAIDNAIAYNRAVGLMEERLYDDAKSEFEKLGDYKDASQMVLETQYQKADYYALKGQYEDAINIWRSLGDYSDSKSRITSTEDVWKGEDYQASINLMNSRQYEEAAEGFKALEGYKDSLEKAEECIELQKEKDYEDANKYVLDGKYKNAIDLYEKLNDYKDASSLYLSTSYDYAEILLEEKDYNNAITYFSYANDYKDAKERRTETVYEYACFLLENKNYVSAIAQFEDCQDYKDSEKKVLDTKYSYVIANKNSDDANTYKYLNELIEQKYSGAQALYNDLYRWKATVYAVNTSADSDVTMSSISRSNKWFFHIKLEGGEPGAETEIIYEGHFPDGSVVKDKWDEKWHSGNMGNCYFYYNNPQYGAMGLFTVNFYDENGNKIGSGSVEIIN